MRRSRRVLACELAHKLYGNADSDVGRHCDLFALTSSALDANVRWLYKYKRISFFFFMAATLMIRSVPSRRNRTELDIISTDDFQ